MEIINKLCHFLNNRNHLKVSVPVTETFFNGFYCYKMTYLVRNHPNSKGCIYQTLYYTIKELELSSHIFVML